MAIVTYLQQVRRVIEEQDGLTLSQLMSTNHPHVYNLRLEDGIESRCQAFLESPYDEMAAAHLRSIWERRDRNVEKACRCQVVALQSFLKLFQAQKEENWCLPVMKEMVLDLRLCALEVEKEIEREHKSKDQRRSGGQRKPAEMLEKAADIIMGCFRACVSDNRTQLEFSKRWGTLGIANQLFKIYFRINKLPLCKPLIRAIESSDIRDKFGLADQVTYRYFVGKKAMFDSEFKKAEEYLRFAFERCYSRSKRNKRLILIYLIPVEMLMGNLPKKELLRKYDLPQFSDIATAMSKGNLLLMSQALQKHEAFFIHYRIYLILVKLKMIVYRNLFKKVYLIHNSHLLNLSSFQRALHFLGEEDVDCDEVQCIIANLIDKSYIRGYITHQHQKLVVSKQNPFPALSTILK